MYVPSSYLLPGGCSGRDDNDDCPPAAVSPCPSSSGSLGKEDPAWAPPEWLSSRQPNPLDDAIDTNDDDCGGAALASRRFFFHRSASPSSRSSSDEKVIQADGADSTGSSSGNLAAGGSTHHTVRANPLHPGYRHALSPAYYSRSQHPLPQASLSPASSCSSGGGGGSRDPSLVFSNDGGAFFDSDDASFQRQLDADESHKQFIGSLARCGGGSEAGMPQSPPQQE